MKESLQHKLDRIRTPRVHITYDVEIGGAVEVKELPFVIGVLADLSGNPSDPLPKLKERKFVEIDRDNFDEVMKSCNPRVTLRVPNKVSSDTPEMSADLHFESMEDFEPGNVIKQIPKLNQLYQTRLMLKNLLTKMDGNDDLISLLQQIMDSSDIRTQLQKDLAAQDQATQETKADSAKADKAPDKASGKPTKEPS